MDIEEIGRHIYRLIKDEDLDSFNVLYKCYHDMVFNFVRMYALSRGYKITIEDAEEICNNVFVHIWKIQIKEKKDIFKIDCEKGDT